MHVPPSHTDISPMPQRRTNASHYYIGHELVGEGAFGKVYRGVEQRTGMVVAMKYIKPTETAGITAVVLREIALLKELRHVNLVRLFDVVLSPPQTVLVLEYCDCDLHRYMARCLQRRLDPTSEVPSAMRQLFKGLSYLHEHGIVHRDIKPANILLNFVPACGRSTTSTNEDSVHTGTPSSGSAQKAPPMDALGSAGKSGPGPSTSAESAERGSRALSRRGRPMSVPWGVPPQRREDDPSETRSDERGEGAVRVQPQQPQRQPQPPRHVNTSLPYFTPPLPASERQQRQLQPRRPLQPHAPLTSPASYLPSPHVRAPTRPQSSTVTPSSGVGLLQSLKHRNITHSSATGGAEEVLFDLSPRPMLRGGAPPAQLPSPVFTAHSADLPRPQDSARVSSLPFIVKLADFGLARVDAIPVRQSPHTVATLPYRSPEALMNSAHYTSGLDMWAAGAVLFEIVTGKRLFQASTEAGQLLQVFELLGSPSIDTWPSMWTYPYATNRLLEASALLVRSDGADLRFKDNSSYEAKGPTGGKAPMGESNPSEGSQQGEEGQSEDSSDSRFSPEHTFSLEVFSKPHLDDLMQRSGFSLLVGWKGEDLLRRCLKYEPSARISADDALRHPFFEYESSGDSEDVLGDMKVQLMRRLQMCGM